MLNSIFNLHKTRVCFLIFIVIVSIKPLKAQTLQFNRVINIEGSVATGPITVIDTVPIGKVWKITSLSLDRGVILYGSNTAIQLSSNLNEDLRPANKFGETGWTLHNIIWFGEGDFVRIRNHGGGGSYYWFSIIEFSIVP